MVCIIINKKIELDNEVAMMCKNYLYQMIKVYKILFYFK